MSEIIIGRKTYNLKDKSITYKKPIVKAAANKKKAILTDITDIEYENRGKCIDALCDYIAYGNCESFQHIYEASIYLTFFKILTRAINRGYVDVVEKSLIRNAICIYRRFLEDDDRMIIVDFVTSLLFIGSKHQIYSLSEIIANGDFYAISRILKNIILSISEQKLLGMPFDEMKKDVAKTMSYQKNIVWSVFYKTKNPDIDMCTIILNLEYFIDMFTPVKTVMQLLSMLSPTKLAVMSFVCSMMYNRPLYLDGYEHKLYDMVGLKFIPMNISAKEIFESANFMLEKRDLFYDDGYVLFKSIIFPLTSTTIIKILLPKAMPHLEQYSYVVDRTLAEKKKKGDKLKDYLYSYPKELYKYMSPEDKKFHKHFESESK